MTNNQAKLVPVKPVSPPGEMYTFTLRLPSGSYLGREFPTQTFSDTIPIDFLCTHIYITALRENPNNPAVAANPAALVNDLVLTQRMKVNITDNASQESWIITDGGSLTSDVSIPAALFAGPQPTPLPGLGRPLFQGTQITAKFEAEALITSPIKFLTVNFMGRRMDSMTKTERDIVVQDPRTHGSAWLYFDPLALTRGDAPATPGAFGPESEVSFTFSRRPWNFAFEGVSAIITKDTTNPAPVNRGVCEFQLTNLTNRKMTNLVSTTALTRIHASTMTAPFNAANWDEDFESVNFCCPRNVNIGVTSQIPSQSSYSLSGRSVFSPFTTASATTQTLQFLAWGSRTPLDQRYIAYPFYNKRQVPNNSGIYTNPNTGFPTSTPY